MKKIYSLLIAFTLIGCSTAFAQKNKAERQAYNDYVIFMNDVYDAEEQITSTLDMLEGLINDVIAAKKKGIRHEDQNDLNTMIDVYNCLNMFHEGLEYLIEDLELAPDLYKAKDLKYIQEQFDRHISIWYFE